VNVLGVMGDMSRQEIRVWKIEWSEEREVVLLLNNYLKTMVDCNDLVAISCNLDSRLLEEFGNIPSW
jgi:hypothetical protein